MWEARWTRALPMCPGQGAEKNIKKEWMYVCVFKEATATHSSVLAQKIPWTEEPGRLQSVGSQRVGHNFVTEHMYMEN